MKARHMGAPAWIALVVLVLLGVVLSLSCGPMGFPDDWLTIRLRLPRIALALLAGSSLSVSGCLLQGLLRNELATPYTLGISAGASLAAGALILLQPMLPVIVFLGAGCAGALGASFAVWALAGAAGGSDAPRLLLAGVTVNLVGASLLLLIEYFSPASRLIEIIRWMMGDLAAVDATVPAFLTPFVAAGLLLCLPRSGTLNQLSMGDDLAASRGVRVGAERNALLLASSLLAGGTVGAVGPIGFVGLIVPHAMRRLTGSDNRLLLPASALGGMAVLLFADVLSRVVAAPAEIPIGVVMSLLGGPFFLVLLFKEGRRV
ncbi:MAG: iron ABC transporter permease [Candidatus Fermentibacter daniensis]|nr:iron ABC transporter permease [Candidatus Fermentibacter daniensis]